MAAAAESLGRLKDARALGPLISLLHRRDLSVRLAAVAALAELAESKAGQSHGSLESRLHRGDGFPIEFHEVFRVMIRRGIIPSFSLYETVSCNPCPQCAR